jgi:hypothetical protein
MIARTLRRLRLTVCLGAALGVAWSGWVVAGDKQPAAVRVAVPDAAEQQTSEGLLRDQLGRKLTDARTPQAKAALARQLLETNAGPSLGEVGNYVVLHKAMTLAEEGGDVETALDAADSIAKRYRVDTPTFLADALRRLAQTAETADDCALGFERCRVMAEQAIAVDDYVLAGKLATIGKAMATRSRDAMLSARAQALAHEVDEVHSAYLALHRANDQGSPSVPTDTTAQGKFLCFMKGQWARGLPLLVSGQEPGLKHLAQEEISRPKDPLHIVQLADQWVALSRHERGLVAAHIREHALRLYRQAIDSKDESAKRRAERPVAEIESAGPVAPQPLEQFVVEALIDGQSELHITPRGIYWFQRNGAAKPGRHGGGNEPTFIDGRPWMPQWQNPRQEMNQDRTALLPMPIGPLDFDVQVLAVGEHRGDPGLEQRDPVTIRAQHLEQVISIPDTQIDARWYRVRVFHKPPGPAPASP